MLFTLKITSQYTLPEHNIIPHAKSVGYIPAQNTVDISLPLSTNG